MKRRANILIADDEDGIRQVLQRTLERAGYRVETVADGQRAIALLRQKEYDLLLLDLNMRPVDGLQVLQAAREHDPDLMVIILTGHGSLESAVACLRLGAFDYLFKPARPQEILQRVAAGLQRRRQHRQRKRLLQQIEALKATLAQLDSELAASPAADDERFVHSGGLTIDRYHRTATLNNRPLDLTTAEFDILLCLVQASPQPVSAVELVQCALGYETYPAEAREIIKWHIHRLRRKLEAGPNAFRHIKTVRGRGYLWTPS